MQFSQMKTTIKHWKNTNNPLIRWAYSCLRKMDVSGLYVFKAELRQQVLGKFRYGKAYF